jgi:hypothetical protein
MLTVVLSESFTYFIYISVQYMAKKGKLFGILPVMRWTPHDIPSQENPAAKPKSRNPFSLRASAPDAGDLAPYKSTTPLISEPDVEVDARTLAQGQSIFFAMLPIELRKTVYEYVMGNETVHLTLSAKKKKFGHFVCEDSIGGWEEGVEGVEGRECGCRVLAGGRESEKLGSACLGMLRVCRRM